MEGDQTVLPLVFPNGTQAELVYPAELDIAALGVRPYSSGHLRGESPTAMRGDVIGRDFWTDRLLVTLLRALEVRDVRLAGRPAG